MGDHTLSLILMNRNFYSGRGGQLSMLGLRGLPTWIVYVVLALVLTHVIDPNSPLFSCSVALQEYSLSTYI